MEKLGCGTICKAYFCTRPEKKKKDIQVVRVVKDVMTKKTFVCV